MSFFPPPPFIHPPSLSRPLTTRHPRECQVLGWVGAAGHATHRPPPQCFSSSASEGLRSDQGEVQVICPGVTRASPRLVHNTRAARTGHTRPANKLSGTPATHMIVLCSIFFFFIRVELILPTLLSTFWSCRIYLASYMYSYIGCFFLTYTKLAIGVNLPFNTNLILGCIRLYVYTRGADYYH